MQCGTYGDVDRQSRMLALSSRARRLDALDRPSVQTGGIMVQLAIKAAALEKACVNVSGISCETRDDRRTRKEID